jgi:hypothetical protein
MYLQIYTTFKNNLLAILFSIMIKHIPKKIMCNMGTQTDESYLSTMRPSIKSKSRVIYSYNLTDSDCINKENNFNKDKILENKNIAGIGVSTNETIVSKCGDIDDYIKRISDATHIIGYKASSHYGSLGGVFENIYEIVNGPIVLSNREDFIKYYTLKPGVDISQKLWDHKLEWINEPTNYGIHWNVKLVKKIIISGKGSGINIRSRFGRINEKNSIYTCF